MNKPGQLPIDTRRLSLRPLAEEDLPLTLAWRNRDDVRFGFNHSEPLTEFRHREWFSGYRTRDDDFMYVIRWKENGDLPIGQLALFHIDRPGATAEIGRMAIGVPEARGQGFASEAFDALVRFAFGPLGLRELRLEVFRDNADAVALYARNGFEIFGERDRLVLMRRKA